jgi:hypothetical protein
MLAGDRICNPRDRRQATFSMTMAVARLVSQKCARPSEGRDFDFGSCSRVAK